MSVLTSVMTRYQKRFKTSEVVAELYKLIVQQSNAQRPDQLRVLLSTDK